VCVIEKNVVSCLKCRALYQPNCSMRSFVDAASQYEVQWAYNQSKDKLATMLVPASQLRLMALTGGREISDISSQAGNMETRDGFFHMDRLKQALESLDRSGWSRSYHQRKSYNLNPPP
jgi:hypothetical protein